jgi:DNA-binding NtrC family response regulator
MRLQDRVYSLVKPSGEETSLQEHITVVGRRRRCDLTFRDSTVSLVHCVFIQTPGGTVLLDLESTSGTAVNGQRVHRMNVCPGLRIEVGNSNFCTEGERRSLGADHALLPSAAMAQVDRFIDRVAASSASVVITGESGVGKDGVAVTLHRRSRRPGAFITINSAGLRPELARSELFGHRRGAFTGAVSNHAGAFKAADQGTLFLDEIGDLSLDVQADLLRALEAHEVRSVGAILAEPVDVRLVTATNKNLLKEVREGRFREDLYHRICVIFIPVPPLRERPEDIEAFVHHYLARQSPPHTLSEAALRRLMEHGWSGNIRQLLNVLERACAINDVYELNQRDLQLESFGDPGSSRGHLIFGEGLESYRNKR